MSSPILWKTLLANLSMSFSFQCKMQKCNDDTIEYWIFVKRLFFFTFFGEGRQKNTQMYPYIPFDPLFCLLTTHELEMGWAMARY